MGHPGVRPYVVRSGSNSRVGVRRYTFTLHGDGDAFDDLLYDLFGLLRFFES